MEELKPCPFCGSSGIIHFNEGMYRVACVAGVGACLVAPYVYDRSERVAVKAWNARVKDN